MSRGKLIVLSGPSGVGKGTVAKRLLEERPNLRLSISATTRPMREGEVDGENYFFIGLDAFKQMIAGGEFLEYAEYVGNYYGTPLKKVIESLEEGYDVLLEIEVKGSIIVKAAMPEAVLIFLTAPLDVLEKRIINRSPMVRQEMEKRLARAEWEFDMMSNYEHVIENDDLDETVEKINRLLDSITSAQ